MRSARLLFARAVTGASSAALAQAASERANARHWNRASQRIIRDAQERIALAQAGLPQPDGRVLA